MEDVKVILILVSVAVAVALWIFVVIILWFNEYKYDDIVEDDGYMIDDFYSHTKGIRDEDSL